MKLLRAIRFAAYVALAIGGAARERIFVAAVTSPPLERVAGGGSTIQRLDRILDAPVDGQKRAPNTAAPAAPLGKCDGEPSPRRQSSEMNPRHRSCNFGYRRAIFDMKDWT